MMIENYVIKAFGDCAVVIDGSVEDGKVGAMGLNKNVWLIEPKYDFVDYFTKEKIFICIDNQVHFFNENGEPLTDDSFDLSYGFMFGVCIVEKDSMLNVINTKGKLMLEDWCASVSYPIIENIDGEIKYVLSVSYNANIKTDGENSEFIKYVIDSGELKELK